MVEVITVVVQMGEELIRETRSKGIYFVEEKAVMNMQLRHAQTSEISDAIFRK